MKTVVEAVDSDQLISAVALETTATAARSPLPAIPLLAGAVERASSSSPTARRRIRRRPSAYLLAPAVQPLAWSREQAELGRSALLVSKP